MAIAPGTEAALALGLAHVILSEGLYNYDFAAFYSAGFESWRQMVLAESPRIKVAPITGIEKDAIVALAREFAKADAGVALCGRGRGMMPGGIDEAMAVHSLNALVGAVNRKGGGLGPARGRLHSVARGGDRR